MKARKKGLLVGLNISRWSAQKKDLSAVEIIANEHGTKRDRARFYKTLISGPEIDAVMSAANRARAAHNKMTYLGTQTDSILTGGSLYVTWA